MVEGLGATVTTEKQPFEPEGGAYGGRSWRSSPPSLIESFETH